jgi:hypothetical protein
VDLQPFGPPESWTLPDSLAPTENPGRRRPAARFNRLQKPATSCDRETCKFSGTVVPEERWPSIWVWVVGRLRPGFLSCFRTADWSGSCSVDLSAARVGFLFGGQRKFPYKTGTDLTLGGHRGCEDRLTGARDGSSDRLAVGLSQPGDDGHRTIRYTGSAPWRTPPWHACSRHSASCIRRRGALLIRFAALPAWATVAGVATAGALHGAIKVAN